MFRRIAISATILFAVFAPFAATAQDANGSADHPLIGRYDGSSIHAYQFEEFGEVLLKQVPGPEGSQIFEGELTRIHYKLPRDVSVAEAFRNFQNSLVASGFEVVYSCVTDGGSRSECSHRTNWMDNFPVDWRHVQVDGFNFRVLGVEKTTESGGTIHAQVLATKDGPVRLLLTVLEEAGLENHMIDATAMQNEVMENGRIALYGVYFDTDSVEVKPESDGTLAEMATFLRNNPGLDVIIVGHTDNQGSMEYNLDLSARRAGSIRNVLIADYGISEDRIQNAGVGFLAPVASNLTADGRALNRRVEIVAR